MDEHSHPSKTAKGGAASYTLGNGKGWASPPSGTTINLTTVQTGSATGYPLSGGFSTSQPGTFSGPSFSISLSGSNMTGGADSTPGSFSLSSPAVTLYTYDTLGNMTCAVQKGQDTTPFTSGALASSTWRPQSFIYNSLSQLLTATNPESGTIQYAYDLDGNLHSKTNARGITMSYLYDALNRVYSKSYQNDPTGTVGTSYGYDGVAGAGSCPRAAHSVDCLRL